MGCVRSTSLPVCGGETKKSAKLTSVRRETIQQAVAAGALQVRLRTAAVRSARRMRRIPGFRGVIVAQSDAVDMTDHRGTLRRACPVLAGAILAGRKRRAVGLRARQRVVAVRRIAAAVDDIAFLAKRSLLGEIVGGAVQVGNVFGDNDALGILPRPLADAVARIHRRLAVGGLRGEISAPGLGGCACSTRQRGAMLVGALETAEIGTLAGSVRGDKEGHIGRLGLRRLHGKACEQSDRRNQTEMRNAFGKSGHSKSSQGYCYLIVRAARCDELPRNRATRYGRLYSTLATPE